MKNALGNIFHSAWSKYTNFGSDIGGYIYENQERPKEVFIRWAEMGALVPVILLIKKIFSFLFLFSIIIILDFFFFSPKINYFQIKIC